jgi:predicted nucleotidyltransferase
MALTSPALDLIVAALQSGPPLRFAMLFGSAAKGTQRTDSDIDIGIVPEDPELSLAEELTLQTELSRVSGRQVDLVRLDRASTILRWQVVRYGRTLVEADPFAAARFRAETVADYLDFVPAFERAAENFRRALTAGRGTSMPLPRR